MTPEQALRFKELYEEMYSLCGGNDPFSYARAREINMAATFGHTVADTYSGADAYDGDIPLEYSTNIINLADENRGSNAILEFTIPTGFSPGTSSSDQYRHILTNRTVFIDQHQDIRSDISNSKSTTRDDHNILVYNNNISCFTCINDEIYKYCIEFGFDSANLSCRYAITDKDKIFWEECEKIEKRYDSISTLLTEINEDKNEVEKCLNCSLEINSNVLFCRHCGQPINGTNNNKMPAQVKNEKCVLCNYEISSEANFCLNCGQNLNNNKKCC